MDRRHGPCLLTDDPSRVDADALHRHLSEESHGSRGIARPFVETVVANSPCLSPRHDGEGPVGAALDHPDIRDLRRIMLATRDAHDLHARFGLTRVAGDPLPILKSNSGANHARGRTVVDAVAAPRASTFH